MRVASLAAQINNPFVWTAALTGFIFPSKCFLIVLFLLQSKCINYIQSWLLVSVV